MFELKCEKASQKLQHNSDDEQFHKQNKKLRIKFKTFEPIDTLYYCFFIEPKRPTQKRLKRKKQKLFKIDYIEDTQRFCYYPGTEFIYTFLGFQTEEDRIAAMQEISLKSSMLNRKIDIYSQPNIIEKSQNNSKSEILNTSQTNQINTEKVINEKKQDYYELSYFIFIDVFQPNDDLFYLFFEEKLNLTGFTSSIHLKDQIFRESLISDIQRFVYIPNTHKIRTFLGFLTLCELEFAINNPIFQEIGDISLYFEDSIIEVNNDRLKVNKIDQKPQTDYYKNTNYDLEFKEFVPKKNTIYIYFIERHKPDSRRMRSRNRSIRPITRSIDIQRYSYYPGTKDIYSFFGFESKRQYKNNINNPNLQSVSIDGKIYLYLSNNSILKKIDTNEINIITPETLNNISKNELNYNSGLNLKEFEPKENIIYLYFIETNSPKIHSNLKSIKSIKNASDVQRFCCYPGTNNVYSFFGYLNQKQVINAVNDLSLQSISLNKEFFIYFKFSNQNEVESLNLNASDFELKEFVPIDCLVYFYFVEKMKDFSNFSQILSKSIKGIKEADDIQRFRLYPGTEKIYSFFGFSSKEKLLNAIENSNFKIDEIYQLTLFNSKCNENHSNIADIMVVNMKYFHNNSIDLGQSLHHHQQQSSEHIQIESNDDRKLNSDTNYSSLINELIEKQIKNINEKKNQTASSNQNSSNNEIKDELIDLDIYGEQTKENENPIDSTKLPLFNDYTNNDLTFNEFKPKENLFYCFIAEKVIPNERILNDKNKKLFKINSSSEIQRFCYYPSTKNIYTFIGFSNEDQLNKAMKKSSLKSASINQSVFIYPFELNDDDDDDENDPLSKELNQYSDYDDDFDFSTLIDDLNPQTEKLNETEEIELMESILNDFQKKEEMKSKLPISIKYKRNDIDFKTFVPERNLVYCFFAEKNPPSKQAINRKYSSVFGINYMSDVQRFCYYPDTENIYSFIGFSNEYQIHFATRSLKLSAVNNSVYRYPYISQNSSDEHQNESVYRSDKKDFFAQPEFVCSEDNSSIDKAATPKPSNDDAEELSTKVTNKVEMKNDDNNPIDKTTTITTTTAFIKNDEEMNKKVTKNCNNLSDDAKLNQTNEFELKLKSETDSNNDTRFYYKPSHQNDQNIQIETSTPKTSPSEHNKDQTIIFDSNESFFEQDELLYYLYFKEKNNSFINHQSHDANLFGINEINDLQRGFRFNKDGSDYFTFMGFIRSLDRAMAVTSLRKNDEIITSSVQLYEDEYKSSYSSDEDDDGKEEVKTNKNLINANSNQTTCFENKTNSPSHDLNSPNENSNQTAVFENKTNSPSHDLNSPNENSNQTAVFENKTNLPSQNSNQTAVFENKAFSPSHDLKSPNENLLMNNNNELSESSENNTKFRFKPAENSSNDVVINSKTNNINTDHQAIESLKAPNLADQSSNSIDDFSKESTNQQERSKPIQLPTYQKYPQSELNFNEFVPKSNHYYCFFPETNEPNSKSIRRQYKTLFGYRFIPDIQRYCYYPGTKNVYTFLGFLDKRQQDLALARKALIAASLNQRVYIYPYELENRKGLNSDDSSTQNLNQNIIELDSNISMPNAQNLDQNIIELDSNNSMPSKQNLNQNIIELNSYDSFQKTQKESKQIDETNSLRSINDKETNDSNDCIHLNSSIQSSLDHQEKSSETQIRSLFHPNDGLFYIYFKERENPIRFHQENDATLFGIKNIKNIQRGFKINLDDSDFYTFLGFDKAIEMALAKNILLKKCEVIDALSIQQLYDSDDKDDSSSSFDGDNDDDDDDESDDHFKSSAVSYTEKIHF